MSTPSGPYGQMPPSGAPDYGQNPGQNPPPYPGYQPYPGAPMPPNPYGQPGAPTYPQPYPPQAYGTPYPGYPMPPQPQRNSNKTLWIILGVVGGVLLLACVACAGIVVYGVSQVAHSSVLTAAEFCTDEETQDYTAAYNLFSSNLQSQISQTQFAQDSQSADTSTGLVTACDPAPTDQTVPSQSSDTTDSYVLTVTRGGDAGSAGDTGIGGGTVPGSGSGTTTSGVIRLTNESGTWKIDYIDPLLGLS